ncbi:DNA recombination protein RmuC [Campylobacter fetus subsp. venerealis]|uniref:DNA recombination protein RmuC n=1 Tax=Campylobacter fetus TaxID=196 RepID=UPI001909AA12|nr:DNA recombination protein RmuC [Campylobacter fetus]MBK3503716.1 DNA recombination protein RmuC [Campylobacter fetus subsp. venerealis]
MEIYILLSLVIFVFGALIFYQFLKIDKFKFELKLQNERFLNLQIKFDENRFELLNLENKIQNLNEQKMEGEIEKAKLKTKLDEQINLNLELKARQDELDLKTREYFELKTKEMSQHLLNLNTKSLGENSQKILENLINPLKNEIEKYQKESVNTSTIFKANFENLKTETKNIISQAKNLADALNGNKKVLRNWGEIQLDSVLEASGLINGKNYFKQVGYKDKDGNQKYLDVVVDFGESKKAIIDSKCSLVNYNAYFNAQSDEQKNQFAKALAGDIKKHIELLSSKEYQDYDTKTYEYIFMFVPNDSIFYTALNQDSTIYEYAYEKGIFITTPLTLLMALKTVYICWRNLKSDENAMRILSEAGRMYDKFRVFTEQFDKLESQLNTVIKTVSSSKTTLYDGSGNLLSRFENLKKLGAKTNKNISKIYNESAENNLI